MDKEKIVLCEKLLLKAMKENDVDQLDRLIHQDLLFVIPNGQIITKEMDLDGYESGNMKIDTIISKDQTINLVEDTAVVSVIIEMKGSCFEDSLDGTYRFLRVWKLINDQYRVIAGSSSLLSI